MLARVPSEISLNWVYITPLLATVSLGYLGAYGVMKCLNSWGLIRYFWQPGLVFLAFWVLLTSMIGLWLIPP